MKDGDGMEGLIQNKDALLYMLAGKSEVTFKSLQTGKSLSFKLTKKESHSQNLSKYIYFINFISGGDSIYAGMMHYDEQEDLFKFSKGSKGQLDIDTIEIKGLLSVINKLQHKHYDIPVEIYHCGRCGKCGKRLTTPESILTGIGPKCAEACGIPHPKSRK